MLVGNGGGYGYGVMGATHHALEDYGALLCLPHLRAYVPAFDSDVPRWSITCSRSTHPAYLRLGLSEEPSRCGHPALRAWRKLQDGRAGVILVAGPLVGSIWQSRCSCSRAARPTLWLPERAAVRPSSRGIPGRPGPARRLLVVEEHVAQGGVARLAPACSSRGHGSRALRPRDRPQGYLSGRYGSQKFHRRECGLDAASIARVPRRSEAA